MFHSRVTNELYRGTLPGWQKRPLDLLIAEGRTRQRPLEDIAYVLATAHHETGRFRWMAELGEGQGRPYGEPVRLSARKFATYYGRGFVHLTWLSNYAKMGRIIDRDLVNSPDLAAERDVAAKIIWEGMIRGTFTGHSLADYINPGNADFRRARQIVNGMDKAELIAGYAETFLEALEAVT